ncbi:hypothetical protein DV738_g2755, partial [Chaetothyriales sp. CBS 135597]
MTTNGVGAGPTVPAVPIVDIRNTVSGFSLVNEIQKSLNESPRSLPTLLLYDEKGLKLFEDITYLDDYYLTNAEIDALHAHSAVIAAQIPAGSHLVELGSGNLRKVKILLDAFEQSRKVVHYYALDISLPELERTFSIVDTASYKYVQFKGLYGTYDDGLIWLREQRKNPGFGQTCVISLGSSVGNFSPDSASKFLADFATAIGPADTLLIGLDACQDLNRVFKAYNDSKGVTTKFYRNGLDHANRVLGFEGFKQSDWQPDTNVNPQRHQAGYVALRDVNNKVGKFAAGERIVFEVSCKYSTEQSNRLWQRSKLKHLTAFTNKAGDYTADIPHSLPDLSAPKPAKTLFQIAEERRAQLLAEKNDDDLPLSPIWDTLFLSTSLSAAHFTLSVLTMHQYAEKLVFAPLVRATLLTAFPFLTLAIHLVHGHLFPRALPLVYALRQTILLVVANVAGCYLIYLCNDRGYYAVMKDAPNVGTVWVLCVIEMGVVGAVLGVLGPAAWARYNGYEIF